MKKVIILFTVDVTLDNSAVEAAFTFDPSSKEFQDFETNILQIFEDRGYDLAEEMHSNRDNSKSRYYMFTKTQDKRILEVLVRLRVSDHAVPDKTRRGQVVKQKDLSDQFVKDYAEAMIRQTYPDTKKYKSRNIEIIFDGISYNSYDSALAAITKKLDSINSKGR